MREFRCDFIVIIDINVFLSFNRNKKIRVILYKIHDFITVNLTVIFAFALRFGTR